MGCQNSKDIKTMEQSVSDKDEKAKKNEATVNNEEQATNGSVKPEPEANTASVSNEATDTQASEQATASSDVVMADA